MSHETLEISPKPDRLRKTRIQRRQGDTAHTVDLIFLMSQQAHGALTGEEKRLLKHMIGSTIEEDEVQRILSSYIEMAKNHHNQSIAIHETLLPEHLQNGDVIEIDFLGKKIATEKPCAGNMILYIDELMSGYAHGLVLITAEGRKYVHVGNVSLPIKNRGDRAIKLVHEGVFHVPAGDIGGLIQEENIIKMQVYRPHPIARMQYRVLSKLQQMFAEFKSP